MRIKNDVMRSLQEVFSIEKDLKSLREKHTLGDDLNLEINRLCHKKSIILRGIGRELQLRYLEGDTIVRINKSI